VERIHKKRLLKLAIHLETGVLGHKEFAFNILNAGPFDRVGCGTKGCAIGECPVLFPEDWKFSPVGDRSPILRSEESNDVFSIGCAAIFFGLSYQDTECLFVPGGLRFNASFSHRPSLLKFDATKELVAASIRKFVTEQGGL